MKEKCTAMNTGMKANSKIFITAVENQHVDYFFLTQINTDNGTDVRGYAYNFQQ
jgi:hypothetical protein